MVNVGSDEEVFEVELELEEKSLLPAELGGAIRRNVRVLQCSTARGHVLMAASAARSRRSRCGAALDRGGIGAGGERDRGLRCWA